MSATTPASGFPGYGWVFLDPSDVPAPWRKRAVNVSFVPLLPGELAAVLRGEPAISEVDPEDEPLLRLAAEGLPTDVIARRLGISPRVAYRRLARLRERFGVASKGELSVFLARRGF